MNQTNKPFPILKEGLFVNLASALLYKELCSTILTPYNDMVVKLVKQAEESQSVPNFASNIKNFEELNK
ncbi:hypothetical protein O0555_13450 [Brevibacillus laterosporus]|uniref:Uncharacterized protein n=1 Tax=Brevibacillus laterosporus TaxID=1465 RepID=A0AAP3DHE4_BRELA|nr:hypothetical protein [Brevibacillus laterosporus]MBG9799348.1 hypothetical protein [Brevibacillus laterosporus]MCR8938340.1 hypothetical protein [Brevibacillus laterosporus]MCR8980517.1 hypothetical protein [Brevibacillus laterosporus]MCZ0807672.1 hypothetical protein [Brevibacillus laterosporus]MCZ0827035.1 hypothetical protein [Brevibacillus laterosporus]